MQKYKIKIFGKKTITAPTPPIIPSISKSLNGPSAILLRNKSPICSTSHSIPIIGYSPMTNVPSNIRYIKRKKIGNPQTRWVTIESSTFVVCACSKWLSVNVSFSAPLINPYLASVIADSQSSFIVSWTRFDILSRTWNISSAFGNVRTMRSMSGSFSNNLMDRKRVEYLWRINSFLDTSLFTASIAFSISGPWLIWICRKTRPVFLCSRT